MDYTANQDTQQCILHLKNKKEPQKRKQRGRGPAGREGGFGKKFRGDGPKTPPMRTRSRLVPRVHVSRSTLATKGPHSALRLEGQDDICVRLSVTLQRGRDGATSESNRSRRSVWEARASAAAAAVVPQSAAAPRVTGAPIVTRQPQMHRRSGAPTLHRHLRSSSAGAPSSACTIVSTCASPDWIVTIRKYSSLSRRSCIT